MEKKMVARSLTARKSGPKIVSTISNLKILQKLKAKQRGYIKASVGMPSFDDDSSTSIVRPRLLPFKKRNVAKKTEKKRRRKFDSAVLKEIQRYQRSTECLIPRRRFVTLVREVLQQISYTPDLRIQLGAVEALQEAAEAYLVSYLEDANVAVIHSKRVTIMAKDMALIKRIRNEV